MFKNIISQQYSLVKSFNSLSLTCRRLDLNVSQFRSVSAHNAVAGAPRGSPDDLSEHLPTTEITDYNRKNYLMTRVKSLLNCTQQEIKELISKEQSLKKMQPTFVCNIITYLLEEGLSKAIILENPWLLLQREDDIREKIPIIKSMEPKKIDDFVPLAVIKREELYKLAKIMEHQRGTLEHENRIYYFSDKLKVAPHIVAKYFVKYPFMFTKGFDTIHDNLNVLLEHQILPIHILRDLRSFRYKPESNKKRLVRAKEAQKEKLMPWMTRCSEATLVKCLQLSLEKKNILGENENVPEYLAERLGYDMEIIEYMVKKHPLIVNVRMKKLQQVLDFLLNEAQFSPTQIVQVPKILSHSLDTTKKRLEELKSIGYTPNSLSNLCKSKREYQKIVDIWREIQKKKNKDRQ